MSTRSLLGLAPHNCLAAQTTPWRTDLRESTARKRISAWLLMLFDHLFGFSRGSRLSICIAFLVKVLPAGLAFPMKNAERKGGCLHDVSVLSLSNTQTCRSRPVVWALFAPLCDVIPWSFFLLPRRGCGARCSSSVANVCRVNCPFYFKMGACRHGDRCSRAHNRCVNQLGVCNSLLLLLCVRRASARRA
jgi:hypothetical protein